MKFLIERTSTYDEQPCSEAMREPCVRIDERVVAKPDKLPGGRKAWFAEGRNHRVEHGHIMRDFDDEAWFVEISDLPALMEFVEKYGAVILGATSWWMGPYPHIEIYDDYRE